FKHHLLFSLYTKGIKDSRANKSSATCEPVGQQKYLSQAQKKKRRIHGMADKTVHAVFYQRMPIANFQRDRPVSTEINMTAAEKPQRRALRHRAEPCNPRNKRTIERCWKPRQNVNSWDHK